VSVQLVCPGLTETGFSVNSIIRSPDPRSFPVRPMSAEAVGRIMVRAARRGSRHRVISAPGRLLTVLHWLSPAFVDFILTRTWRKERLRPAASPPD
jgi:short-subunit dehydrogenase